MLAVLPCQLCYANWMRLCSYKMTVDTGFAPNPFGCTLTLATCKPGIRNTASVGDWIAGFTSKGMAGHGIGAERLVYLMRVGEKLLLRDYFHDARFEGEIPDLSARAPEARTGDNIYRPLRADAECAEDFEQLPNANHIARDRQRDIGGRFVLVADEFYYFGGSAPALPREARPEVPPGQARYGRRTCPSQAERFLRHIRANYRTGRHGQPHNTAKGCAPTRPRCA